MYLIRNVGKRMRGGPRHARKVRIGWLLLTPGKKIMMTDQQYETYKDVIERYRRMGVLDVLDIKEVLARAEAERSKPEETKPEETKPEPHKTESPKTEETKDEAKVEVKSEPEPAKDEAGKDEQSKDQVEDKSKAEAEDKHDEDEKKDEKKHKHTRRRGRPRKHRGE